MLLSLRVSVLLGHTEVDNVDDICCFGVGSANEEVVWFDVSINEILLVDRLHSRKLEIS